VPPTATLYAVGAKDAERIAQEYGDPALAKALIWLSDYEFFAKVKRGTDRPLHSHVRAFPPLEPRGDESYRKDALKTSRMRWGKNRKDMDAGIVKLLNRRNWRGSTSAGSCEIGIGDLYGARER
jgi:hypothetical protein